MPHQNTSPADYPQAILQSIEELAQNIVIARKRRGETQAQWARKLGVSQPTMARIERGDPAVAMASYVMCLWLINPTNGLADLIAPQKDHAALEQELHRVRAKRTPAKAKQASRTAQPPLRQIRSSSYVDPSPPDTSHGRRLPSSTAHVLTAREAAPDARAPTQFQGANPTAAGLSALLSQAKPRLK